MSIKAIDTFISNSVKLFEANPSQSLISITYQPSVNKNDDNQNDTKKLKKKTNAKVTFKTSNSHINSNYKFTTFKTKDVSRLLHALGPSGVAINQNKIAKKKLKNKENTQIAKPIGLSTLLVNTEVQEYTPVSNTTENTNNDNNNNNTNNANVNNTNTTNANKSTSGKKKKNKKKR